VTPALERVTLKALAREPNNRYASAAELAEAIKHARLASSKTDAFAATIPATITPRPSAPPVDPNAPTLLGDSVIPKAALASRAPPPGGSRRPPSKAPPPPEASTKIWVVLWIVVIVASIGAGSWFALRH
jgi:serine/threonine-protein kinase